ncbi:CBS domain-containing protein [Neorhodopirellula lusitana]|uniref:CBS domain-containing protein n=1 Tax=Neorhodopirellula lusitana TaxID=445327 RepID=A0ABY1QIH5_9BACT|nr:CBS domain-containing protein [Neorhodopirellula lusitana]SMP72273.1 CBS domain-containing protein [Neorhodopirellula lusitana]
MHATQVDLEVPVHSFMRRQPVSILETETVQDAVEMMAEHHLSALPVVDENKMLKGMVTVNDMLRLIQNAERTLNCNLAIYDENYLVNELIRECLGSDPVSSVMSTATITAEQDDSIQRVSKLMIENQVHHIPVMNHDKKLVGVVSTMDFVRFVNENH